MVAEDKTTEIFCVADNFYKFFDAITAKYTLKPIGKRKYQRSSTLSKAEVMLIMILFLSKSLSETLIIAPFMLLFNLVKMAKMLTYFFKIEMFKAAITGSVEKNHYQHDFCL